MNFYYNCFKYDNYFRGGRYLFDNNDDCAKTLDDSKPIVHRGVQSPTWKNTVPPKVPIPIWNDITYYIPAKLSDSPKIKFPVHSHLEYIIQRFSRWLESKLTMCRVSLIGTYWYQSTNRFINSYLFMHSHKGGLSIDLMIKPPLWEYINKLENYI